MITRSDVAKHAGVSNTTVSRVLNNNGYVSPESRDKVESAIKELGYLPNLIARSLKTKKSNQLLYCVSDYHNPFYMEVYAGMEEYSKQHGYTIVVASEVNTDIISQRQFDGIVLSYADRKLLEELQKLDIPVVINNYTSHIYTLPSINIDIENGALSALSHLLDNGHKRIAFLTNIDSQEDQRLINYKKFLSHKGIDLSENLIVACTKYSSPYMQGYDAAIKLMESNTEVTAAFVFNDAMAIGAIAAFQSNGFSVPDHISIIGFDNIEQATYSTPALTTIDIPRYTLGEESIKMLLRQINGEAVTSIKLDTKLLKRSSVKKLHD